MDAKKNLMNAVMIALWAVAGIAFTLSRLFVTPSLARMTAALAFWLWFAGFAALTTWAVSRAKSALAPLVVHGAAFLILSAIPRVFPLSLARLGLDLLTGHA